MQIYTFVSIWALVCAGWTRLFAPLPTGIHQVVIEGQRAQSGSTGIVMDDLVIKECAQFGELLVIF